MENSRLDRTSLHDPFPEAIRTGWIDPSGSSFGLLFHRLLETTGSVTVSGRSSTKIDLPYCE
ncbi:MAG: hypothetical protein VX435_09090 [Planctomycetota bacterium]|nr:hypothetical protein [Planctomycetota bacterium]